MNRSEIHLAEEQASIENEKSARGCVRQLKQKIHAQWLPTGNGQPAIENLDELDNAEKELELALAERNRIASEIRAGNWD